MKQISIKTQKLLMYLPYINILNLFIWLYNSFYIKNTNSTLSKTVYMLLSISVPMFSLQILLSIIWPRVGEVFSYTNIYFIPLLISSRLIKHQEELLDDNRSTGGV